MTSTTIVEEPKKDMEKNPKADTKKRRKSRLMSGDSKRSLVRLGSLMAIEATGTFLLVALPTGVATAASVNAAIAGTPADSLGVAFAFGGVLALLVWLFSDVSGAHFNPAVTLALVITDGFDKVVAVAYIAAQLVGAVLGSLFVTLLFVGVPDSRQSGFGVTQPGNGFGIVQVALVEFIGTAILMIVISRVTDPRRSSVPAAAIGVALGVLVLCFGPVSGGAFNPARALGPMFVSGQWDLAWVYVLAPVFGAVTGAFVYTRAIVAVKSP